MHHWDRDTSGRLQRISTSVEQGCEIVDRPKHIYKFIAQLLKDYCLIPVKLYHKTC